MDTPQPKELVLCVKRALLGLRVGVVNPSVSVYLSARDGLCVVLK